MLLLNSRDLGYSFPFVHTIQRAQTRGGLHNPERTVHIYIYILCMCVCAYVRTYVCMYICMYICMYVYIIYIYMYIYIHIVILLYCYIVIIANYIYYTHAIKQNETKKRKTIKNVCFYFI